MHIIKKNEQIFELVKPYLSDSPFILEAGSFTGHDTLRLATFWPRGTVHALEPVPDIYEQLKNNTLEYPNTYCHQLALSDTTGSAQLYRSEKPNKPGKTTQASSLLAPKERLTHSAIIFPDTITIATTTIDAFAAENNINHLDFLWLDLQGYELPVLQAAPHILPTVKALYCEVQFIESYAGNPLYAEVRAWLEQEGFVMIARDFEEGDTKSFFGNILMVRKE